MFKRKLRLPDSGWTPVRKFLRENYSQNCLPSNVEQKSPIHPTVYRQCPRIVAADMIVSVNNVCDNLSPSPWRTTDWRLMWVLKWITIFTVPLTVTNHNSSRFLNQLFMIVLYINNAQHRILYVNSLIYIVCEHFSFVRPYIVLRCGQGGEVRSPQMAACVFPPHG